MALPDNIALGYIVLVDGQKLINNIIEIGTESEWSHVAMVLCAPDDIVLNPTIANTQSWYCFESNTTDGDNVHLISWQEFMTEENQASVAVRALQYDPDKMPNSEFLKAVVNKYLSLPYETETSELVLSAFGANTTENLKSLFCSELVALVLQDLGLLSANKLADNYVPADFSNERLNALQLIGVKLGDQVQLQSVSEGIFDNVIERFTSFTRFLGQRLGFIS